MSVFGHDACDTAGTGGDVNRLERPERALLRRDDVRRQRWRGASPPKRRRAAVAVESARAPARRAGLHPLRQRVDLGRRQPAAFRHLQRRCVCRTAWISRLFSGSPGTIAGPDLAALEQSLARVEAQAAHPLVGVAVVAVGGEHRAHDGFEECRRLRGVAPAPPPGAPPRRSGAPAAAPPGRRAATRAQWFGESWRAIMHGRDDEDCHGAPAAAWRMLADTAAQPKPGVKTAGVKIPIERLQPEAVFPVPGSPDWIAVDEDVWISNKPKDSVARLERRRPIRWPRRFRSASVPARAWPPGSAACGCPTAAIRRCRRVDLKTGAVTATIPCAIGNTEGSIAAGAGSIWIVTDTKGTLARLDPATNTVVAEIYVAPGSYGLTYGEDALWVTSSEQQSGHARRSAHQPDRRDHRGRQDAALHRRRRRRGVDAEPGRRQRVARSIPPPTRWSRRSRSACPAAAATSPSARDRCG